MNIITYHHMYMYGPIHSTLSENAWKAESRVAVAATSVHLAMHEHKSCWGAHSASCSLKAAPERLHSVQGGAVHGLIHSIPILTHLPI